MKRLLLLPLLTILALCACEGDKEHLADAVTGQDTLAFMRSRGISTLISDSGVIRYKLVAEEWDIYTNTTPATWKFNKGMLMERFDEGFHIDLYVQADTAYLHEQRTWELRGRVVIRNIQGTIFRTEELFWDMNKHEMWSYKYIRITSPERELEGTEFHSNEQMTEYFVSNSAGAFPVNDTEKQEEVPDTAAAVAATQAEAAQPANDTPAANIQTEQRPLKTPNGQKAGRIMPTAPAKNNSTGHWK